MRNYQSHDKISETYNLNHTHQTLQYTQQKINQYCTNFDITKMSIWDAINKLDNIIDESDPDTTLSQINHAFQTAEGVRKMYPHDDALHLIGLLHDLGKVLLLPEFNSLPQWSVVGDTFPLGVKFSKKIVYHEHFKNNPDTALYNTKYGIYNKNCGLDNLFFSFSHDIYFYSVCKNNNCLIPEDYLKIIKYHSAYIIHKDNKYRHLLAPEDHHIIELCQKFSECDLYTKTNTPINKDELFIYYNNLINKYFPKEILDW